MARIPPLSGSALSSRLAALEARVDAPGLMSVTATGATTARSLAARFADVVNVKDHGAKGDGVTDDTAAIRAAITAASRAAIDSDEWNQGAGGTVFFPRGVYVVSDTLTLATSGVYLAGEGLGTSSIRMDADATTDAISITSRKCGVRGLWVFASDTTSFRDGISTEGEWQTFADVYVSRAARYGWNVRRQMHGRYQHCGARYNGTGLLIGADANGVESTSTVFDHFYAGVSSTAGVIVGKAFNVTFVQLISEQNGAAGTPETSQGIVIGAAGTGGSSEVTLVSPYFEGNYGWDVEIGNDDTWAAHAVLINPTFRNTAHKQSGYGLVNVDRVTSGAIIGGKPWSLAAPAKAIRFTANAYNFSVKSFSLASNANPTFEYADGSISQYKGLIETFDGSGSPVILGKNPATVQPFGRVTPTHADPTLIDAALGSLFQITVAGAPTNFAIGIPSNGTIGQVITIRVKNTSGGAITPAFNGDYQMAAYTPPADGFSNSVSFTFTDGLWFQTAPQTDDLPNA